MNTHQIADLAVIAVLALLVVLYCVDAVRASTHVYNLIMVLPLTILALVLCGFQFIASLRSGEREAPPGDVTHTVPVMLLFAGYVLSLNWLGFDIGTAAFVGAFLWSQGERRWARVLGYSLAFALTLTLFFGKMLPYPMPVLLPIFAGQVPA